ncbi:hypothetical protein GWI33_009835, partial [Rhynchophorus ferrugineus]
MADAKESTESALVRYKSHNSERILEVYGVSWRWWRRDFIESLTGPIRIGTGVDQGRGGGEGGDTVGVGGGFVECSKPM